jgi:HlyD family secretion protein
MLLKKPTIYFAGAGIVAAALMVARLHSEPPLPPPPITPPTKPYAASIAASGIVETLSDNVALGVPEAGLVAHVYIKVWDFVEAGQPLFTLDDRDLQAQLTVNEANAAVADATLRRLRDQLTRLQGVNDPRAVSRDEVRTKENDVAVAQAQLDAARALVAQSRVRCQRMMVTSPRAGTILQLNVRPGEYASATPKSPAILLGDLERLQVRADVDEQNAASLQPGQAATAYVKGDTTSPITLRFLRIEPFVTPKVSLTGSSTERVDTRVLQVIYAFDRPKDRNLYVGQQVDLFVKSEPEPIGAKVVATTHGAPMKGRL